MRITKEYGKLLRDFRWIAVNARTVSKSLLSIILLDAFTSVTGVITAVFSKNLIDSAVDGTLNRAALYAALFGALIIINLGIKGASSIITVRTTEVLSNNMRKRVFSRITRTEWMAVNRYHSGDILTRLTSDVGAVTTGVVDTLPGMISLGVQLAAAFATLLYYEPTLALLAFVLGPFTVLFSRIWGRKIKRYQIKVQESESVYRSFLQEAVENMLIVKAFSLEEKNIASIASLHSIRLGWVKKRNVTSVLASTILGLGYWAGYFLAFCWGALKLGRGATTFGTLTAFLQLVSQVQGPFVGLARMIPQVIAAVASAGRLMEIEDLPSEESENKLPAAYEAGIKFQGVTFWYSDGKPILERLNVTIRPGEIVGLIGPSGEGKTTLIRMLLALLKPEKGSVLLTTRDNREYFVSAGTRDWISYVPQGNTLFSGTIEENLLWGFPEATGEEIVAAAGAAGALDFINELPEGMQTKIGEHGIGLSEGQAQRISIARALLRKAPILILDEATSALDRASEVHVLTSINGMRPARTCIVITHRYTALSICSRVLRLKEGKLLEQRLDDLNIKDGFIASA
ncbi:putative ABC transporter ATP-binding protein [Ruminiclostridium hungatei]|uniref:Putative ABC transporter ATP-binding protein n=1 Tax=Ruminiclostridium hungatei TaxID=48256 RepID=A0A1V4SLR9_RUMHU|nr:ABC transporter ATP-binding protein [Ruminiclostridium hungatei]OPX44810.1 putative ABC transporter ATP-binding protein [Ruminiclostridium hungatei]